VKTCTINTNCEWSLLKPFRPYEELIRLEQAISISKATSNYRFPFQENRQDVKSMKLPKDGKPTFIGRNSFVQIMSSIFIRENQHTILNLFRMKASLAARYTMASISLLLNFERSKYRRTYIDAKFSDRARTGL
jgi:hypothetical protein